MKKKTNKKLLVILIIILVGMIITKTVSRQQQNPQWEAREKFDVLMLARQYHVPVDTAAAWMRKEPSIIEVPKPK